MKCKIPALPCYRCPDGAAAFGAMKLFFFADHRHTLREHRAA